MQAAPCFRTNKLQIESPRKNPFKILLDGELYGPFYRIKAAPCQSLDKKARELDEKGATDPAALAQIYTEAADMQVLKFSAKHEAVVRCRKRAAELAGPKYSECAIQ